MLTKKFYLVGAGGHAKVVIDALLSKGAVLPQVCLLDSNPALNGKQVMGFAVSAPLRFNALGNSQVHIAIGNNIARQSLYTDLIEHEALVSTIIHSAAIVSNYAYVEEGTFVAARAIIAPAAHIGRGSIINHGSIIDHDCIVGEFCHVAPGATLAGGVCIGKRVLVGAGVNILPGVCIEDDAVIGAGAVVTRNVSSSQIWMGVPATQRARK